MVIGSLSLPLQTPVLAALPKTHHSVTLSGAPPAKRADSLSDQSRRVLTPKQLKQYIESKRRLRTDGYHDLRHFTLVGDFEEADLSRVDLSYADLTQARFNAATMRGAILRDVRARGVSFAGAVLEGADLRGADLRDSILSRVEFVRADLRGADMRGARLDHTDFTEAKLKGAQASAEELAHLALLRMAELGQINTHVELVLPDIRNWARNVVQLMCFSDGVKLMGQIPSGEGNLIRRIRALAKQISLLMEGYERGVGPFRQQIHNHAGPQNVGYIESIIAKLQAGQITERPIRKGIRHRNEIIGHVPFTQQQLDTLSALLNESLTLAREIYSGQFNRKNYEALLSPAVANQIAWPKSTRLTLKTLGALTISVRETFDRHRTQLSSGNQFGLMSLADSLARSAYAMAALEPDEAGTEQQVRKIALLVRVLYGSGYGHRGWLEVARRFDKLAARWQQMYATVRARELKRYGALAASMIRDVQDSYHDLYDEIVARHWKSYVFDAETRRNITNYLYRETAVFQLGVHVASLNIERVNWQATHRVLELFARDRVKKVPFQPMWYGELFAWDERSIGGKAVGLDRMAREGYPVPPGFVLPMLPEWGHTLSTRQRRILIQAARTLVGRSERERFSVRSGGPVSMPGAMDSFIYQTVDTVVAAAEAVYQSANDESARAYRLRNGIPEEWRTAVNVVAMIDGQKDRFSGSGVASSRGRRFGAWGFDYKYGREAKGIDLVNGANPGRDRLPRHLREELSMHIRRLENERDYPVEVEFTIESGKLYLLQVRRAHFAYRDQIRWAASRVQEKIWSHEKAIAFLGGRQRLKAARSEVRLNVDAGAQVLARGGSGSGVPIAGRLALTEDDILRVKGEGADAILVTTDADAKDAARLMSIAGAGLVRGGNPLSHLAGVAKTLGLSLLQGINFELDEEAGRLQLDNRSLPAGSAISLDPRSGIVYEGELPLSKRRSTAAKAIRFLLT